MTAATEPGAGWQLQGDLAAAASSPVPPGPAAGAAGPIPTVGVDPGQTWTAAVLRIGEHADYGWTLGPPGPGGELLKGALNDVDAWMAFRRYVQRLVDALDELVAFAQQRHGDVRVAVEVPHVPAGYAEIARHPNKMPIRDWVVPRQIAAAVLGAFPAAVVVVPDHHGRRPSGEYPRELRGKRLPHWGPNEARQGERDHERAAFDVAGAGAVMPR